MTEDPAPDPLRWIAKAGIVLGIASLIRFGPELVLIVVNPPSSSFYAMLAVDIVIAALWLKSGLALRKHALRAIGFAAVCGAAILAHGLVWGCLFGREIARNPEPLFRNPALAGFAGSRMLIYSIECVFWPYALHRFTQLTQQENPTLKWSVLRAIVGAFLVAAALQLILFATAFDR